MGNTQSRWSLSHLVGLRWLVVGLLLGALLHISLSAMLGHLTWILQHAVFDSLTGRMMGAVGVGLMIWMTHVIILPFGVAITWILATRCRPAAHRSEMMLERLAPAGLGLLTVALTPLFRFVVLRLAGAGIVQAYGAESLPWIPAIALLWYLVRTRWSCSRIRTLLAVVIPWLCLLAVLPWFYLWVENPMCAAVYELADRTFEWRWR